MKNINGRRWDLGTKVSEVPYTRLTLSFVEQYLKDVTQIAFTPAQDIPETLALDQSAVLQQTLSKEVTTARHDQAVTALEQVLMLKRYSLHMIKIYKYNFRQFIRHYDDIKPSQIGRKQIYDYVARLIREKHIFESHQN